MARIGLRWLTVAILLTSLLFPFIPQPAYAISAPSSTPTITNIKANRNLLETGDVLIYGDYLIPYSIIPNETADQTYVFRLMLNGIEKAEIIPYVLMDSGYNLGVFSFYFPAATNLTWDTAYTIRISQNPSYFTSPTFWDYTMPLSSYSGSTLQSVNQAQLTINILAAAQRLSSYYTPSVFTEPSPGGTILSSPVGENYFRGTIYGIQAMAPDLFLVQILTENYTASNWTITQYNTYLTQFDSGNASWVGGNTTAIANEFGMTGSALMAFLFILPLSLGIIILSTLRYHKTEPGLVIVPLFMILGALMGWLPLAIFASINQMLGIYLAWLIVGARA